MLYLKQILNVLLVLHVLSFFTVCEARRTQEKILTPVSRVHRRLLKQTNFEEFRSTNSSVRLFPEEALRRQNLVVERSDESSRRNLFIFDKLVSTSHVQFQVFFAFVNGHFIYKNGSPTVGRGTVTLKARIEDRDQHCPGCMEQVYFVVLNLDNGQLYSSCYNMYAGNDGEFTMERQMNLGPGRYGFGIVGAWEYECYDRGYSGNGVFNHMRSTDAVGQFTVV